MENEADIKKAGGFRIGRCQAATTVVSPAMSRMLILADASTEYSRMSGSWCASMATDA